jgi:hypothetical protein
MNNYLESVKRQFEYYKMLGEKAMEQVPEDKLFWQFNEESNSIATIVKHLWGNMLSRWTDFLTTDGEKEWRNRDAEFDPDSYRDDINSREQMMKNWNEGWNCVFVALNQLTEADLNKQVFIRNQGQTVVDAINRQLAHYPHHIGQILFIGKVVCGNKWRSLSIPKGKSKEFNADKFSKPKHTEHFTDEFLKKKEE